jgi:APA family basic amino acid/polyamine antiporter
MAELKKVISYRAMLLIVINSTMGTGIFFLPAIGALYAGPASLISWVIIAAIAIYISVCFGELASMYPGSGGIYEFSKQAYGRFFSFMIGWMAFIAANVTIAMLIVGAIQYLLPYNLPLVVTGVSIAFILIFNMVAYRGMKVSTTMLVTFAFITLGTILLLIVPSLLHFSPQNLTPFFTLPKITILLAVFFIAETFFGWESPTYLAGEVKDGARVVPRALVWGTTIVCGVSLLFVFSALGALHWESFGASIAPLRDLARLGYGAAGVSIFTLLIYMSIIGSVADWVVSTPRLLLSMAKDKLFLSQFSSIHPKYFTPYKAIIFQTVVSVCFVIIGVGRYTTLLHMLVPLLLILYSVVLLSVTVLRVRKPREVRHIRVPFAKVGPVIIAIFFAYLIIIWKVATPYAGRVLNLGFSFALLGVPVYLMLQLLYNPSMMRRIDNVLAYFALYTERFMVPKSVRSRIVKLAGINKGSSVFEFGCSVGTLTLELAEVVGRDGRVYATDISETSLRIAQRRVSERGHPHVILVLDEMKALRIPDKIPVVEVIISVSKLSYVQDVRHLLEQMNKRLKKGGMVCFVEYDKFFHLIPNIGWLRNTSRVRHVFRQCGLNVQIERKRGLLWETIYIYGKKL